MAIENGRARFAYDAAKTGNLIKSKFQVDNVYYKDENYETYVKKIPMMIKTNGLGATFAFVLSKKTSVNDKGQPGTDNNPKNAYDLIYAQTNEWLKQKGLIQADLIEELVAMKSVEYKVVTNEVLALFNWLRRFADGLQ